jgi:hypothetical protein
MSIFHPCTMALTMLTLVGITLPATAQSYPPAGESQRPRSSNVLIGDRVQVGASSSVIINGQGYSQSRPQVIPSATVPVTDTNCHRSVVVIPIPNHYAKDSVMGAICR